MNIFCSSESGSAYPVAVTEIDHDSVVVVVFGFYYIITLPTIKETMRTLPYASETYISETFYSGIVLNRGSSANRTFNSWPIIELPPKKFHFKII